MRIGIGVALLSALSLFQTYAGQVLDNFINLGRRQNGSVPVAGTTAGGDYYTVIGGGYDIWERGDECGFAYHKISGDFDIKVQVIEFLGTTDADGACCPKAGIMVRENLAEDSRRVMMAVGGLLRNNNQEFLWRTGLLNSDPALPGGGEGRNGGYHSTGAGAPTYPNAWIRVVREGALFTGFYSPDGVNWTQLQQVDSTGWQGGAMPSRLVVGLAVAPHYSDQPGTDRATAIFTNYTETASRFCVGDVSSRGAANKVFVAYNRPYGAGALEAANYTISDGAVNAVLAGPDAKTVLLDVEPLTEGTTYTVTVDAVLDADGNTIDGGCVSGSFVQGKGYEQRRIHIQHNIVQDGNEDFITFWQAYKLGIGNWAINRPGFEGNTVFEDPMPNEGTCPDDWGNTELTAQYAGRIVGVLAPTASGNFTFAAANDDAIRVWLSQDVNLDAKQQIIARGCCIGWRNFGDALADGAGHSAPQALVSAKQYALDAVYEEGCGGNYGHVAWDGDGLPIENGKSPIQQSFFTPSRFFANTLFFTLGDVSILTQPVAATSIEGQTATFAVTADGTPPYRYQWKRDGVDIPGATGRTFTTPALTPEWDNAQISVCVANEFSETCSAAAALTVIFDNTAPTLVSVEPYPDPTVVLVHFNEPVEAATGTDAGNYALSGGSAAPGVASVVLLDDLSTAKLTLDGALEPNTAYTVQVSDVRDRAVNPNTLAPNPSSASFISFMGALPGVVLYEIWSGIGGTALSDLTGNAAYPNYPSVVGSITTLDSRLFYPTDDNVDYGARMTSWLIPTVTGDYTFDQYSDDAGVLYLGRTGNPSSAVAIAGQSGCCAHIVSAPVHLVAGQPYFIQTIYKEGGGGDVGQIQWKAPGDTGYSFIPNANLVMCARMDDLTQPADVTALQMRAVTFCVGAGVGLNGLEKQWSLLGAPIEGATGRCYTTPLVDMSDEGNEYACTFSFMGNPLFTTRTATLHVNADSEPPVLVAVECSQSNPNQITFAYSEAVAEEGATDGVNYLIDGLNPVEAFGTLLPDGRTVLFTIPAYQPGSVHTIQVDGVYDLAGNPLATVDISWTACPLVRGWATYDIYPGGDGATLDITLTDPNYPNNPTVSGYIKSMNSREFYPDDAHEQYGARMRAYFVPPTSGNWIFQIRSDDAARLSFNASGMDFAGMATIIEYANCCESWDAHQSAAIPLVAGQGYAIEMLYREGGGGDYGGVVARLDSQPAVTGTDLNLSIPGCYLAVAINPPLDQTLTLAGPADASAPDGTPATFTVTPTVVGTALTPSYLWEVSADAGATWQSVGCVNSATYVTPPVTVANNGKLFRCIVTLPGVTTVSRAALLTVTDNPAVVSVSTRGDLNNVYVTWNKPVKAVGTYEINDVVVNGAAGMPGQPNVVVVNTEEIAADTTHTLTITGELNADDVIQFPNPTVVSFGQGPGRFCTDFSGDLPLNVGLFGNATKDADGSVHLTEAVNSLQGSMVVTMTQPMGFFKAHYKLLMGNPTTGQADGYSLSFGSDVANAAFGEGGSGSGLIVRFNTYAGWFRGMLLYWKGVEIARVAYTPAEVFTAPAQWSDMDVELSPAGQVTVRHAGNTVFNAFQIPGYTPITGNAKFGFGARTGGENQQCYIDDICINDFTLGPVVATVSPATADVAETFTATFTVSATGSPWLFYAGQWYSNGVAIAGATGLSYTTAPITALNEGDQYTYGPVSNFFSSATSAPGVIHVLSDLVLVSCSTMGDPNNVYVTWNKPVQGFGVYDILGAPAGGVIEASVMPGQENVVIVNSEFGLPADGSYTVTVAGEVDVVGNAQVPDPASCSFSQPLGQFCADFNDGQLPAGTSVRSTSGTIPAYVDATGGFLHLTDQANDLWNYWTIPIVPQTLSSLKATWKAFLQAAGGADGYSFNVGQGPFVYPDSPPEGTSVGLSVTVDTYNNGTYDSGFEIRWNGARLAYTPVNPTCENCGAPAEMNNAQWVDASVEVTPSGAVTFKHGAYVTTAQIPNFTGLAANQYEFGARTGGANENCWIDDLCINNYTLGPIAVSIDPPAPSTYVGVSATLTAVVTGSPWYTYQWSKDGVIIPGATGPTYTTPPAVEADNGAVFSVTVNNSYSGASADATLTVLPNPVATGCDTLNDPNHLYITFNRPVNTDGDYQLDGGAVAVEGIAYGSSQSIIVLQTETLAADVTHTVTISGVTSLAGGTIDPNPTTLTFKTAIGKFCTDFESFWVHNVAPRIIAPPFPWRYDTATSTWVCWDKEACEPYNGPYASGLNTPALALAAAGEVVLTFQHRYDFEPANWDGGQVFVSVNGGAYTLVTSFTANGYTGDIAGNMSYTNTPDVRTAFLANSGGIITSTAVLGTFNAGDTVSVRFMASWDDGCGQPAPNWEIVGIDIGGTVVPLAPPPQVAWATYGNAYVGREGAGANNVLHLTDAVNGQQGTMIINLGQPVQTLKARYKVLIGDGAGQADGIGFSFGSDIQDSSFGEWGSGRGLIVTFNTYAGSFRGIKLSWAGTEVTRVAYTPPQVFSTPAQWCDMAIDMDAQGRVTVVHAGNIVFDNYQIPGFTPITGNAKVAFSGRTGGENEKNWIDDVCINDFQLGPVAVTVTPASATATEACGGAKLTALASGSPPYTYQWLLDGAPIAGATGSIYTTPPLPVTGSPYSYSVTVNNLFSTATSGEATVNVIAGCGKVTVAPASTPGYVTINWSPCCRLQVATELKSDPTQTLWMDVTGATPPLTVPVPYNFGAGPLPVLFLRTVNP